MLTPLLKIQRLGDGRKTGSGRYFQSSEILGTKDLEKDYQVIDLLF